MPESKEPKPNLPLIGIVLLAATVGGVYFYGKPFESLRPRERAIETSSTLGPQFVPARLWEDPFTAVFKRVEQRPDQKGPIGMFQFAPAHSLAHLGTQIRHYTAKDGKLTIIPVMVFGGPYAEQIEDRRRKRYAVLSALAVSAYEPVDSEHIDYFHIAWEPQHFDSDRHVNGISRCLFDQSSPASSSSKGCLVVPYEWLVPSDKKSQSDDSVVEQRGPALVLWLDDNLFNDQPLSRLEQLIRQVLEEAPANNVSIKIIGPAGSTTLREMVQEACERLSPKLPRLKNRTAIYSPNATVPDTLLIPESHSQKQSPRCPSVDDEMRGVLNETEDIARRAITKAFEKLGITFRRMIPTDNDLARSLKDELKRRRVDLTTPTNHIVLIAEWDTFYGRSLPATFSQVFTGNDEEDVAEKAVCPYGVCWYSYMRGLDGEAPNEEKEAAKTGKEGGESKKDSQALEKAIGDSQFDYLRRLGERIKQEMEETRGNVQAIGVLGSDVYDKLLILQSLHDRFPSALFFTTDLDARYAHRAESKWTRNLIVGSGFGLKLHSGRQGKIPPFRDSYQTAVFYAVQGALKGNLSTRPLTPRLFEIGRRQPIDLSVDQEQDPDLVHPKRVIASWRDSATFIITIAVSVVLALLLLRALGIATWRSRDFLIGSCVIVAPIVVIGALVTWQDARGEPFDLWEGISLWPSEAIRLYALILACGFIWRGKRSLGDSNKELSEQYDLNTKTDLTVDRAGVGNHRPEEISVRQLWASYREGSRGWLKRVGFASVVYLVFVRFVSYFISRVFTIPSEFPTSPGRGEISFVSDGWLILLPAVLSLIVLIFFVVDATGLCRGFIKRLVGKPCEWPLQTLAKFAEERGMSAHPDDLNEWLTIRLIAARTRVVGNLIYYPFIVLLLMIVARSHLFDRWVLPWQLVLVFGLNAAWVIGCAVALRNRAEKSRRWALERLNQKLSQTLGGEAARIERIRLLIHEVEGNREGAFCPLSEQPVIRTILLFLGGSGSLIFLESFIQSR